MPRGVRRGPDLPGALLWREFFDKVAAKFNNNDTASGMIGTPYDNKDPVGTPDGLVYKTKAGKLNAVPAALASAVKTLTGAGIPLDAPLGDWQHTLKDGKKDRLAKTPQRADPWIDARIHA